MSEADPEASGQPVDDPASSEGIFNKTWEIELLISGGVVFALLQLPSVLERGFLRLEAGLTGWWTEASFFAFVYLNGILYTLIGSFLLHLASRAYWIGLIGLDKVYPEGVRWEKLKSGGPITQRLQRELVSPLRPLIVRIDLFCSAIFSFAFLVVLACLISILMIGLYVLIALGISWLPGGQKSPEIFLLIVCGVSLVLVLAGLLDKLLAGRLKPGGRMERALAAGLRSYHYFQLGPLFSPILLVLLTNMRRRSFVALAGLPFLMVLFFISSHAAQRNRFWYSDSPAPNREILPLYYQDQWPEEGTSRLTPSIQSDVIEGPYLKLFIPYLPQRHDEVFAERCPDPRAKLDCAARVHRVTVDGRPVPGLTFHFSSLPKRGTPVFLAYIPTAGFAHGSHVLRIEPLPLRKKKILRWRKDPRPYLIRFWT